METPTVPPSDPHRSTLAARAAWALMGRGRMGTPWLACGACAAGLGCCAAAPGLTLCPFRLLTGLPCPACGLTRALVALAIGHPAEAWRQHPFAYVVAAALLALAVDQLWWLVRGRVLLTRARLAPLAPAAWTLVPAWLAFAISRWC